MQKKSFNETSHRFTSGRFRLLQAVAPPEDVNQRMFLLIAASVMMVLGLASIVPQGGVRAEDQSGDLTTHQLEGLPAENTVEQGKANSLEDVSRGGISPLFTDEVKYWEDEILDWADEFELDPDLVAIIMQVESCGDPQAISIAGAQGLFQVMPFHFAAGEDSLDPGTNARRGIKYFVDRMEQTGGDIGRAYAGYNGGHVAAGSSWDNWAYETQRYYIWTTGIYEDIKSGQAESPTLNKWLQAGGASLCRQAAARLGL